MSGTNRAKERAWGYKLRTTRPRLVPTRPIPLISAPATLPVVLVLSQNKMVAIVQKPAPAFKATAVVDGLFQDISLQDYLGQWCVVVPLALISCAKDSSSSSTT